MPWSITDRMSLFHGTDLHSARRLQGGTRVQLGRCRPLTDFGQGFYTTTNLHQAKNWANGRAQRLFHQGRRIPAAVLQFEIGWPALDKLRCLSFVIEGARTSQYWNLVATCRRGQVTSPLPYDVVFGPVSLWPQTLTIKDCDQISFHSQKGIDALDGNGHRKPDLAEAASAADLLFVVT